MDPRTAAETLDDLPQNAETLNVRDRVAARMGAAALRAQGTCATCRFWSPEPPSNKNGVCEITNIDEPCWDLFCPSDFGCNRYQPREEGR